MALRVKPEPVMAPKVPPETTASLLVNVLPGSSLKVKVRDAVCPYPSEFELLLMMRLGAVVSMLTLGEVLAPPVLPRASR